MGRSNVTQIVPRLCEDVSISIENEKSARNFPSRRPQERQKSISRPNTLKSDKTPQKPILGVFRVCRLLSASEEPDAGQELVADLLATKKCPKILEHFLHWRSHALSLRRPAPTPPRSRRRFTGGISPWYYTTRGMICQWRRTESAIMAILFHLFHLLF